MEQYETYADYVAAMEAAGTTPVSAEEFMKNKNRTSDNNYFYPIKFPESVEIDTLDDFKLAEMYELS